MVGSYLEIENDDFGSDFNNVAADLSFVDDRKLPQTLLVGNYSGVFGRNLTLEAQYSKRTFTFEGSGGESTRSHPGLLDSRGERLPLQRPDVLRHLRDEGRDNENILAKATWFGGGERLGTHELSFGVDTFDDIRLADNHQSASDYSVFATGSIIRDGVHLPGVHRWRHREHRDRLLGRSCAARRGRASRPTPPTSTTAGESASASASTSACATTRTTGEMRRASWWPTTPAWSPRLGLSWDLRGDGDWLVNLGYGHYVDALANNIGDASSGAGTPAILAWNYVGPDINAPGTPLISTHEALALLFADWDSRGGACQPHRPRSRKRFPAKRW